MRDLCVALHPADRVLVLGASGWFGQTFLELLSHDIEVLAVASSTRDRYIAWDEIQVRDFAPTVVANFAFLTRERIAIDGEERFQETNTELTRRFLMAAELPSIRSALTVSSGAAITEPERPYGAMKLAEERAALALATASRAVMVARAYSVSGAHVRRPHDYAFSDLILQARSGLIRVKADRPVLRRYVSASDFLAVCSQLMLAGESGVVDSGGELIEMGELAHRVAQVVRPDAAIERSSLVTDEPSTYASDNTTWTVACDRLAYEPMGLEAQIHDVNRRLP